MSKIVTAVGVSANSEKHGEAVAKRIELAMSAAVEACIAEGLKPSDEADAQTIKARMLAAQDRVLADIAEGR